MKASLICSGQVAETTSGPKSPPTKALKTIMQIEELSLRLSQEGEEEREKSAFVCACVCVYWGCCSSAGVETIVPHHAWARSTAVDPHFCYRSLLPRYVLFQKWTSPKLCFYWTRFPTRTVSDLLRRQDYSDGIQFQDMSRWRSSVMIKSDLCRRSNRCMYHKAGSV